MMSNECISAYRFDELRQTLELYSIGANHKLHPPRVERPESERTFASSNYRSLLLQLPKKVSTWIVVCAVQELIKIHAPGSWGESFVQELNQSKKHKSFGADDAAETAQYLCTCGCSKQSGRSF